MIYSLACIEDLDGVSFHCGNSYIDSYFQKKQILTDDGAVTYCFWTDESKQELVGIASLSCSGIIVRSCEHFNITPAIEIKIFAVDERYQHVKFPGSDETSKRFRNWSDYCLLYLMEIVDDIRAACGASHLVLYSVKDAVHFYRRHLFEPFAALMTQPSNYVAKGCTPMFLRL